jgi:hypothetical protein
MHSVVWRPQCPDGPGGASAAARAREDVIICHSGAAAKAEPGIHNREFDKKLLTSLVMVATLMVMDCGLALSARPGMMERQFAQSDH